MSTFDPMAAAVDWLDAYRAASLSIVGLYAENAIVECACGGQKALIGVPAITEYWRERFLKQPAGELVDLRPAESSIVVSYGVPGGVVQAFLSFDQAGKIDHSSCGPTSGTIS
jgi:hypothetical protein